MKCKKLISFSVLSIALAGQFMQPAMASHTELNDLQTKNLQTKNLQQKSTQPSNGTEVLIGMGSGAAMGAAVAGPVGAVVGGVIGIFIGEASHHETNEKHLTAALNDKASQLQQAQEQLWTLQKEYDDSLFALQKIQQAPVTLLTLSEPALDILPLEASVQFTTASSRVEQHYQENLEALANKLKQNPQLRLQLFGYADRRGDEDYNLTLSEKRAESVKAFLIRRGVSPAQIDADGYGEAQPVFIVQNHENDFFDRRVVLRLTPDSEVQTAANQ